MTTTEKILESNDRMRNRLGDIGDAVSSALYHAANADKTPGEIYGILSGAIQKIRALCGKPLACADCDRWPVPGAEGGRGSTPGCPSDGGEAGVLALPPKRDWLEMPFGFKLAYFGGGNGSVFIGKRKRVVEGKQCDQICGVECNYDRDEGGAIVRLDGDAVVRLVLINSNSRHVLNRVGVSALKAVLREKERGYEKRARRRAKARAANGKEVANA